MVKKKRNPISKAAEGGGVNNGSNGSLATANGAAQATSPAQPKSRPSFAQSVQNALPSEVTRGDWTAIILALMMFFAPALGVPHEEMLQDTLKSIIVSFMVLGAMLLFFWRQRNRRDALRWHALMWLPLSLMAYALGSMVWSHTYLGGVEAIRWFIVSALLWLALNTVSRDKFDAVAWGIHCGALAVALLGAAQFWFDVRFIPQGPNPAATFVNRNFAAEFMACTLAFSGYLLARERRTGLLAFMSFSFAFNLLFMLMCGTRSAMTGAALSLVGLAIGLVLNRNKLAFTRWTSGQRILVLGIFVATLGVLGLIKSGNPAVELKDLNAWQRGLGRAATISVNDGSFGVRLIMWKATMGVIAARPLSGVGAGAWEVDIPLYQAPGSQLETDYYVHNEILQLLAEYGVVGWLMLLGLFGYLLRAAWRTLADRTEEARNEAPLRVVALSSILAFLVVSNAGFPWRLAATGALFALGLGVLAASDARLGYRGWYATTRLAWKPVYSQTAAVLMILSLALASYITQQAAASEEKIVKAVKMALGITQSKDYNNPRWDKSKQEMLRLIREGTTINPHYRKITPMVADEVAKWGDWKNAVWIWESVVSSRPYVTALLTNIARGYATMGNADKALEFLQRAKKIQPQASSVRSLEVVLLSRTGKEKEASVLASASLAEGIYDFDMANAAYVLGVRSGDWKLAVRGMELRNQSWPDQALDGYLKIGSLYFNQAKDEAKALEAYRKALELAPDKVAIRAQMPAGIQAKL